MVLYNSLELRDLADLPVIMTVKLKNYKGGNFTQSFVICVLFLSMWKADLCVVFV